MVSLQQAGVVRQHADDMHGVYSAPTPLQTTLHASNLTSAKQPGYCTLARSLCVIAGSGCSIIMLLWVHCVCAKPFQPPSKQASHNN